MGLDETEAEANRKTVKNAFARKKKHYGVTRAYHFILEAFPEVQAPWMTLYHPEGAVCPTRWGEAGRKKAEAQFKAGGHGFKRLFLFVASQQTKVQNKSRPASTTNFVQVYQNPVQVQVTFARTSDGR